MFNFLKKKKQELEPRERDYGCQFCPNYTGKGCKIGNPVFPDFTNIAVTPRDCPIRGAIDADSMTVEEYRERLIQAFFNAECGELVALVCLPNEKDFQALEQLLKKHWKKADKQTN